MAKNLMDGPIPGENFTSDTKNFPWHRPPEYTNLDDAIKYCMDFMLDDESSDSFITMIEMGMTIVDVAGLFALNGIGKGKWTPDYAVLLAGPIAHILVLMCKGYDIEYELGTEPTGKALGAYAFKEMGKIKPKDAEVAEELFGEESEASQEPTPDAETDQAPVAPETPMGGGGLMSPPSEEGIM